MKGNLFGRFHVVHHYTKKTFLLFHPDGPLTLTVPSQLRSTILMFDLSNLLHSKTGQTQQDCSLDKDPLFPRPAPTADGVRNHDDVTSRVIIGIAAGWRG